MYYGSSLTASTGDMSDNITSLDFSKNLYSEQQFATYFGDGNHCVSDSNSYFPVSHYQNYEQFESNQYGRCGYEF